MAIAQDSYIRANQSGWGVASDGNVWSRDSGVGVTNIVSNQGRVGPGGNDSHFVLGTGTAANVNILCRIKLGDLGNVGAVLLRYSSTSGTNPSGYRIGLFGNSLIIDKFVSGARTTIGSFSTAYALGEEWWIRAVANGTTMTAKTWKDGTVEPASSQISITESTITSAGRYGISVFMNADFNYFDTFSVNDPNVVSLANQSLSARFLLSALRQSILGARFLLSGTTQQLLAIRFLLRGMSVQTLGARLVLQALRVSGLTARFLLAMLRRQGLGTRFSLRALRSQGMGIRFFLSTMGLKAQALGMRFLLLFPRVLGARFHLASPPSLPLPDAGFLAPQVVIGELPIPVQGRSYQLAGTTLDQPIMASAPLGGNGITLPPQSTFTLIFLNPSVATRTILQNNGSLPISMTFALPGGEMVTGQVSYTLTKNADQSLWQLHATTLQSISVQRWRVQTQFP